jgi:hypothetical protein
VAGKTVASTMELLVTLPVARQFSTTFQPPCGLHASGRNFAAVSLWLRVCLGLALCPKLKPARVPIASIHASSVLMGRFLPAAELEVIGWRERGSRSREPIARLESYFKLDVSSAAQTCAFCSKTRTFRRGFPQLACPSATCKRQAAFSESDQSSAVGFLGNPRFRFTISCPKNSLNNHGGIL